MKILHSWALAVWAAGTAIISPSDAAEAKRILVVDTQNTEPYKTITDSMLRYLAESGTMEVQNVEVSHTSLAQYESSAENIWKVYYRPNLAVVYVAGTLAARAFMPIMRREPQIKFVFASVTDPVGVGLIDGFRPQNGNVTGVAFPVPVKERLRFLRKIMPHARTIGLVDSDLPQAVSYRNWLEQILKEDPEFKDLRLIARSVPFIAGDNGTRRMAMTAEPLIRELDPQVDLFMAPNDQMGINPEYARVVSKSATKPLLGVITPDAREHWGAAMTMSPSLPTMGQQAGRMVQRLLAGEPITKVPPEMPEISIAFDWDLVAKFGLRVPPDLAAEAR